MLRSSILFVIALIFTSQVSAGVVQDDVAKMEDFFKRGYEDLKEAIKTGVTKIKDVWDQLIHHGKTSIEDTMDLTLAKAEQDGVSEECKKQLKNSLESAKKVSLTNFFSCSNLTDAMVEAGSIVVLSLELTANVTANIDTIIKSAANCTKVGIFHQATCWFNAMAKISGGWAQDWANLKFFQDRVETLIQHINENISYCLHPSQQATSAAARDALHAAKTCSQLAKLPSA